MCAWLNSDDKLQESVSFHDLGPKGQNQLIRFGAKKIQPQSHLDDPKPVFLDQTSFLAPPSTLPMVSSDCTTFWS